MIQAVLRKISSSIESSITTSFCDFSISDDDELSAIEKYWLIFRRILKRFGDIFMSVILLCIASPLMLIIAIAIKITSKGPVFFRQERMGYQGKEFRILKFRTMRHENLQQEHRTYVQFLLKQGPNAENQGELIAQYIDFVDQRTTKVGKFLRATSLDELPQLFNILLGQMSLVGPRPHPLYEVKEYKSWYRRRLCVKPGLTGWSKLNLRLTPQNYEEAILYDLWYVDHWSLALDLQIVFLTIPFVLLMKDAH